MQARALFSHASGPKVYTVRLTGWKAETRDVFPATCLLLNVAVLLLRLPTRKIPAVVHGLQLERAGYTAEKIGRTSRTYLHDDAVKANTCLREGTS